MFAYCNNSPSNRTDPDGNSSLVIRPQVCITDPGDDTCGCGGFGGGGEIIPLGLLKLIVDIFTPSVNSVPEVYNPNANAKAIPQSEAKSIAITAEKVDQKKNQYSSYWAAERIGHKVIVGSPLTFIEANLRVAAGGSIMCKDQLAALAIVKIGHYRNAVGPEIGKGEGFYWHYHPTRNHTGTEESIHIWFYGPAVTIGFFKLGD